MKNFPCAVIILLFVGLAFAGFNGWLKPRPIVNVTWKVPDETNSFNDMARRATIAGASLGYMAAQRGDSWEAVSNVVWKHFTE